MPEVSTFTVAVSVVTPPSPSLHAERHGVAPVKAGRIERRIGADFVAARRGSARFAEDAVAVEVPGERERIEPPRPDRCPVPVSVIGVSSNARYGPPASAVGATLLMLTVVVDDAIAAVAIGDLHAEPSPAPVRRTPRRQTTHCCPRRRRIGYRRRGPIRT